MKTLLVAFNFFISVSVFSQSITNTLGTNGVFAIKDASTNYLTLTQSTGQLNILRSVRLENTTSPTLGILFKGTDRFIHNYYPGLSYNTFIGIDAGNFTLTTANFNTAIGHSTLSSLTFGSYNTALGAQTLYYNTNGIRNTAVGMNSLVNNSTGSTNTAVGNESLFSNTTGNDNTALGLNAGSTITSGNNLTCIGKDAQPTSNLATNQVTLGNNQITSLRCNVTTITSLSDARDKKIIKDLSLGLDFLMKVRPRQFNWDKREWYDNSISDGSKMKETPTAGFIAQELDEVQTNENAEWLNLVLKDNPDKIEATYGNLLPVMVKAIQELKVESEKLKVENIELAIENKEMKQRLLEVEQTQNLLVNEIGKIKLKEKNLTVVKSGEEK